MLTTQQAINEIFTLLKEKYDPAGIADYSHWSRTEILTRLNLAQDRLSLLITDLFRIEDSSLVSIAGQLEYNMPTNIGRVYEVSINGYQLQRTTKDAIQADSIRGENGQYWADISDQPEYYYYDQGRNVLGLWPKPATAGQTIVIDGELIFANLVDSSAVYLLEN